MTGFTGYSMPKGAAPIMTDYYVSSSEGNDSNDGLTSATPWKETTKLEAVTFNPGDRMLLKRGDTWEDGVGGIVQADFRLDDTIGTLQWPVIITSYGDKDAARPKLIHGNAPAAEGDESSILLVDCKNVIVDGIHTQYGNISAVTMGNHTVRNCRVDNFVRHEQKAGIWVQAKTNSDNARNNLVENNIVVDAFNYSYYMMWCSNSVCRNNIGDGLDPLGSPTAFCGFEGRQDAFGNSVSGDDMILENNIAVGTSMTRFYDPFLNNRLIIRNNYAETTNGTGINLQGEDMICFNNFIVGPGGANSHTGIFVVNLGGTALILNNTVLGFGNGFWNQFNPGVLFYNNILVSSNASAGPGALYEATLSDVTGPEVKNGASGSNPSPLSESKNNNFNRPTNPTNFRIFDFDQTFRDINFATLQSEGFDLDSLDNSDPLHDACFLLGSGSPCLQTGARLADLGLTTSNNYINFNFGDNPDIGAMRGITQAPIFTGA